jgi:hypothetical protein
MKPSRAVWDGLRVTFHDTATQAMLVRMLCSETPCWIGHASRKRTRCIPAARRGDVAPRGSTLRPGQRSHYGHSVGVLLDAATGAAWEVEE